MQKTLGALLCLAVVLLTSTPAEARDWFVREGSSGDGSKENPFGDPWQALDKCEAGDAIHVAGGRYVGRSGQGMWEIPFDNVQLIGGYDKEFKERNPWKNVTELWWDPKSKTRPKEERLIARNKAGVVIDGITIDQKEQCKYQEPEKLGRDATTPCDSATRFALPVTVRNCVIVNPGFDGLVVPAGSTVENNIIVNAVNFGIKVNSLTADKLAIATIKNNTIAFNFGFKEPGKGAYSGSGIGLGAFGNVTNNIIANSDNHGIYMTGGLEKTTIANNVFFMNLYSNLKTSVDGKEIPVDDKTMDMFEEIGLKAYDGNEVKNPGLPVDPKWLDHVSRRVAASPGKLEMDDFNKARQLMGLPMIAKGGTPPSGVAPAMDLDDALKLIAAKSAGKAGARVVPLPVSFQGAGAQAVQRDYKKSDVKSWARDPSAVDGKPLELVAGVSNTANVSVIPSQFKKDEYAGVAVHQPDGNFEQVVGFYKKGSSIDRTVQGAMGRWNGSNGKPDRLWVIKGVAYKTGGFPKSCFLIESMEEQSDAGAEGADRPVGKDWYVRAGSSGGNGSKEKPFKDPYQALEKAEAGDFVHVAEGEYNGKLKSGLWKIDNTNISLIGGYDKDFKERNPWKHPTRLVAPQDEKRYRSGYTIEGVDDHTGAIIDGFVFDKRFNNKYKPNGDLDVDNSEKMPHLWLAKPGCIIRNNVFVNGAENAIRAAGGQTFDNNIFINHVNTVVKVERGFDGTFIFKNNTVLFAWERAGRFGEGKGRNGSLLVLETGLRAVIDNNILAFSDNDAIRINTSPGDVELTNNFFSGNLNSHVASGDVYVDEQAWNQLNDLKFKKVSGNQMMACGVPLEQKWFDVYLNRTALKPGKVDMNDWNQMRELLGQPMIATGGEAGKGLAPLYPWDKAMAAFPKNAKCTAGARAKDLPVKFTGVDRKDESFEYTDTTWDESAADKNKWEALNGKRVSLKVVFQRFDNSYQLGSEAPESTHAAFMVTGPDGSNSNGLPLKAYVKKGGKAERMVRQAKSYSTGQPEQWYFVKGVAKPNKQLLVEVVERAD